MLAVITITSLITFLVLVAIAAVVVWGAKKIPMPDWARTLIWVVVGIALLLMVYNLFISGSPVIK